MTLEQRYIQLTFGALRWTLPAKPRAHPMQASCAARTCLIQAKIMPDRADLTEACFPNISLQTIAARLNLISSQGEPRQDVWSIRQHVPAYPYQRQRPSPFRECSWAGHRSDLSQIIQFSDIDSHQNPPSPPAPITRDYMPIPPSDQSLLTSRAHSSNVRSKSSCWTKMVPGRTRRVYW